LARDSLDLCLVNAKVDYGDFTLFPDTVRSDLDAKYATYVKAYNAARAAAMKAISCPSDDSAKARNGRKKSAPQDEDAIDSLPTNGEDIGYEVLAVETVSAYLFIHM